MIAALVAFAVSLPLAAQDTGTVVLYMPSAIVARAYRPHIFLDGQPLLDLRNANVWKGQLAPGHHSLAASDHDVFSDKDKNMSTVDLDVKAGETYYIQATLKMGFRKPNTTLTVVSAEEGARESQKQNPVDARDIKKK